MLNTYLINSLPPTKFVLIEDTLEHQAKDVLGYVVKHHVESRRSKVNYFVYDGVYERKRSAFKGLDVIFHDCVSESHENSLENLDTTVINGIVVIDSLSNVIIQHGIRKTCCILRDIIANNNVLQVIAVLHIDILDDSVKIPQYLRHLATCYLRLEPKFGSSKPRLSFTFKKLGGKLFRQTEEYSFQNGSLVTEPVKKLDAKALLEQSLAEIQPDKLTTFKISLEDTEKESRNQLILPFLPKANDKLASGESNIYYKFDNVDDWDEEDPDDDLDI